MKEFDMDSTTMAEKIKGIIDDRKGKSIDIIDLRELTIVADYFVIASGTSTTHLRGIADEVMFKMEEAGIKPLHVEGYDTASWILLDYNDVIVHIFLQSEREFYNLEKLWKQGGSMSKKVAEQKAIDEKNFRKAVKETGNNNENNNENE